MACSLPEMDSMLTKFLCNENNGFLFGSDASNLTGCSSWKAKGYGKCKAKVLVANANVNANARAQDWAGDWSRSIGTESKGKPKLIISPECRVEMWGCKVE